MAYDEPKCLSDDTATTEDLLGFKPYVEAIAEFLTAPCTLPPITLSIEGQWGCGKSSFMKQLKEEIEKKNLSQVKKWIFLKYLISKNEDDVSAELIPLLKIINKSVSSKNRNLFSLTNKLRAIILYIGSKLKRKILSSQNPLSEVKIWIFLKYLFSKNGENISTELTTFLKAINESFILNDQNLFSLTNKLKTVKLYIDSKIKRKKYFTVWFNAWKCEKDEEVWASFALNFMDELSKQLSWGYRQYSRIKLLHLRYKLELKSDFLIVIHFLWIFLSSVVFFALLALATTYVLNYLGALPHSIDEGFIKQVTYIVLFLTPLVSFIKLFSAESWFIDLFRDPFGLKKLESNTNYKERISFREHFHSDFNKIIESHVGNSKVYIFIDDLDRCEVPKAAELMQAINLMTLDDSQVYFSLGIDRKVISAGMAAKNEKVISCLGVDGLKYGYEFIEKFIQLHFKVPAPKNESLYEFMNLQHKKKNF